MRVGRGRIRRQVVGSGPMVDFQSLYRRYRPQRFSEVRGQDHVVNALRHAVRDDRVAHAYLFSGPRGTGKTSTARILAKALNCTNPLDGEPCGVCDSCVDITRGASFDVHELDAASNNGVEAMRDLVARASLATPGRWKVYIVDEVHMLSASASNALLKTLEEPPDHVVFVLATTDPQKVLPTIRSRTQHYEFHLLDPEVLAQLLGDVATDAELELPDSAVEAAVRRGRGSARDALSALDQVVAAGVVEDESPYLRELLVSLADRDTARALQAIESGLVAGSDATRIAGGLLDELREQFLMGLAPRDAASGAPSQAGLLLGPARSVRAMEVLGAALVTMRDALDTRITLEVAIVRLTHPEVDDDSGALLERIERLERRVQELSSTGGARPTAPPPPPPPSRPAAPTTPASSSGTPGPVGIATTGVAPTDAESLARPSSDHLLSQPALGAFGPGTTTGGAPHVTPTEPPAAKPPTPAVSAPFEVSGADQPPPTRDELVEAWGDHVLSQLRPRVRAVFAVGRFLANEETSAVLALPNSAHVERAKEHSGEVAEALGRHFGRPVRLRLVADTDDPHAGGGGGGGGRSDGPVPVAPARGSSGTARPAVRKPVGADPGRAMPSKRPSPRQDDYDAGEEILDPDDLDPLGEQVPGDAATWAEERLMQVFPGAEEV